MRPKKNNNPPESKVIPLPGTPSMEPGIKPVTAPATQPVKVVIIPPSHYKGMLEWAYNTLTAKQNDDLKSFLVNAKEIPITLPSQ